MSPADLRMKKVVVQKGTAGGDREHRQMDLGELLRKKKSTLSAGFILLKKKLFSVSKLTEEM